jgi:hypothetical protein
MKKNLVRKLLVFGIIIFILSSISVNSADLKININNQKTTTQIYGQESFDLELVSIEKYYYENSDPRDPNQYFDIKITVKNNGSADFKGKIKLIQDINIKILGLNIPRIRRKTTDNTFISPGGSKVFLAFYNNDCWRIYFPGTFTVCYKVYPGEPYNKDDDPNLENNVLSKSFISFILFCHPENLWF